MKKIFLVKTIACFCFLNSVVSNAQQLTEIPKAVKYSFMSRFRDAHASRWVKVLDKYVCTFSQGLYYRDAYFTGDGKFNGTGNYIIFDMLPGMVQNTINGSYSKFEIVELYQYDCSSDGLFFYAVLRNDNCERVLKMTPDGDIVYCQKNKLHGSSNNLSDIAKIFKRIEKP